MIRPATLVAGLACLSLSLSACAAVRRPDAPLPVAFEASQAGGVEVAVLDRWWTQFQDPVLTDLIDQALVTAPDARSAAARLTEARATSSNALIAFLPQGAATGSTRETHTTQTSGTVINIPGFSNSGESTASSASFNVSWEMDLFGRIFAVAKAARGDTNAAEASYQGARASLAANIADTYFLAQGQAIQLEDARETARIQGTLQRVATTKADRGLGSSADADRVAGDLAQAQGQAAGLEAELKATRRTLLVLAGRGTDPLASLPTPTSLSAVPLVPDTVPGELLARRPDVLQAEAGLRSAAGRLTYARLAFFPTFTLTPGVGLSRSEQPGFESASRNWSIGAGLTQPILAVPRLMQDLKVQGARSEQAVIAYEKAVQTAYGEADSALTRLEADRRRVALLTDGEHRAARAFEASRIRYGAGLEDLQSALGAEQSWRSTRSALTSAQVQALRRTVQTYKALGGGWPAPKTQTNQEARQP